MLLPKRAQPLSRSRTLFWTAFAPPYSTCICSRRSLLRLGSPQFTSLVPSRSHSPLSPQQQQKEQRQQQRQHQHQQHKHQPRPSSSSFTPPFSSPSPSSPLAFVPLRNPHIPVRALSTGSTASTVASNRKRDNISSRSSSSKRSIMTQTKTPGASPSVKFLPLGALVQELHVGGVNIVQSLPSEAAYREHNAPYFGETTGRVANRVSGAKINSLNGGKSYQLAANNGAHSLHGGVKGWGKVVFDGPHLKLNDKLGGKEAVVYKYFSKDGEEGYPGDIDFSVTYTAYTEEVKGKEVVVLDMDYEGELVGPDDVQETVINVTNHSYFNLTGGPSIEGTEVTLSSDLHQVVDDASIPLGPIEPYPGVTAHKTFTLGPVEPDIDHCFITNTDSSTVPIDTRPLDLQVQAKFYHPETKIHLEVLSTEPAFQFYTGKYIQVPAVEGMPERGPRSGFCVEPSRYVDAVNVEKWKNQVLLRKGEKYGTRIVYRTWRD